MQVMIVFVCACVHMSVCALAYMHSYECMIEHIYPCIHQHILFIWCLQLSVLILCLNYLLCMRGEDRRGGERFNKLIIYTFLISVLVPVLNLKLTIICFYRIFLSHTFYFYFLISLIFILNFKFNFNFNFNFNFISPSL